MWYTEEQCTILIDQAKQEIARLKAANAKTKKIARPGEYPIDTCDGALLGHMIERFRITEGFHAIFGPVFDALGLTPLFSKIRYNQLRDVVIAIDAAGCQTEIVERIRAGSGHYFIALKIAGHICGLFLSPSKKLVMYRWLLC